LATCSQNKDYITINPELIPQILSNKESDIFILWLVIGYIYPNKYYLALFLSILWEVFERFIVYNKKLYNFVKTYWPVPERYWNEINNNSYIDIVVNMIGYYIGSKI
jgi:hypothetical protein